MFEGLIIILDVLFNSNIQGTFYCSSGERQLIVGSYSRVITFTLSQQTKRLTNIWLLSSVWMWTRSRINRLCSGLGCNVNRNTHMNTFSSVSFQASFEHHSVSPELERETGLKDIKRLPAWLLCLSAAWSVLSMCDSQQRSESQRRCLTL